MELISIWDQCCSSLMKQRMSWLSCARLTQYLRTYCMWDTEHLNLITVLNNKFLSRKYKYVFNQIFSLGVFAPKAEKDASRSVARCACWAGALSLKQKLIFPFKPGWTCCGRSLSSSKFEKHPLNFRCIFFESITAPQSMVHKKGKMLLKPTAMGNKITTKRRKMSKRH